MSIIRASDYFQNRAVNYVHVYSDISSILDTCQDYPDEFFSNTLHLWDFYEEAFLGIPSYSVGGPTFEKCINELATKMPSGESRDGEPSVEFLIIIQMVFTIAKRIQGDLRGNHAAKNLQLMAITENAATRLAYKFLLEGDVYVVAAINPVAEAVASAASKEESDAIYSYLTSLTDGEKEASLKGLALLAGSVANKAKDGSSKVASGLSEYLQLIRHPEKKDEPAYAPFFENGHLKKEFYADIFEVCIYYFASARAKEVYQRLASSKR